MNELLEVLHETQQSKGRIVGATIIFVEGSAYRREGAKMLFAEAGRAYGTLSAGCLESDLGHRAEQIFETGTSQLLTYDMSSEDDFTWGRGTGCNGVIHVLLECIDFDEMNTSARFWSDVLTKIDNGEPAVSVRALTPKGDTGRYLIAPTGEADSWQNINREDIMAALDTFLNSEQRAYTGIGVTHGMKKAEQLTPETDSEEAVYYFFDKIQPREKLFVLGAGPDAEPMVDMLAQIGFDVTVVDHRPVRLNTELFPRAKQIIDARPQQARERLNIPSGSYVIVMTHSFQDDKIWLDFLNGETLRYVGILGPRRRTERLLPRGFDTTALHSPIGLNIHADGPAEIAAAVAAELIQVRRLGDPAGSDPQSDAAAADQSTCQRPTLGQAH